MEFSFISGYRCLDFVNTQVVRQGEVVDLLADFHHLADWLVQAGLIEADIAQTARQTWSDSAEGTETLEQARAFRATLRAMADNLASDQAIDPAILAEINQLLKYRAGYLQVRPTGTGFVSEFQRTAEKPVQLLAPLAETAAELLSTADLTLIKRCGNPDCIRYFYDSTKNHSRRWCDMETCGNRMKVAAYYARKRRAES